jgi:hypothetical protein
MQLTLLPGIPCIIRISMLMTLFASIDFTLLRKTVWHFDSSAKVVSAISWMLLADTIRFVWSSARSCSVIEKYLDIQQHID